METKENFPVLAGPVQRVSWGGCCFFCDPSRISRRKRSLSAGAGFVPGRRGFVAWGFVPDWVFRISPPPPSSLSFIIWSTNHTRSAHCPCPRPSNKKLPSPRRHRENPKATPPKKIGHERHDRKLPCFPYQPGMQLPAWATKWARHFAYKVCFV